MGFEEDSLGAFIRRIHLYASQRTIGVVPARPLKKLIDVNEVHFKREQQDRLLARELRESECRQLMCIPGADRIAVMTLLTSEHRSLFLEKWHADERMLFSLLPTELLWDLERFLGERRDRIVYRHSESDSWSWTPVLVHEGHKLDDEDPWSCLARADIPAGGFATKIRMRSEVVDRCRRQKYLSPSERSVQEIWVHTPRSQYHPRHTLPPKPQPRREKRSKTADRGRRNRR